ncbi:hypothetical protein [Streptomyces sp. WG7]
MPGEEPQDENTVLVSPDTGGVTRLSGETFDDTEGLGLLMGGGGVAR